MMSFTTPTFRLAVDRDPRQRTAFALFEPFNGQRQIIDMPPDFVPSKLDKAVARDRLDEHAQRLDCAARRIAENGVCDHSSVRREVLGLFRILATFPRLRCPGAWA